MTVASIRRGSVRVRARFELLLAAAVLAVLALVLPGCGDQDPARPSGSTEQSYGAETRRPLVRPLVDLAQGGLVVTPSGAEIEVLPGTGSGQASFMAVARGSTGVKVGDATVVSLQYDITGQGFLPGASVVPLLVTLPVDKSLIPAGAKSSDFIAQTYDASKGAWVGVKGFPYYDANRGTVTFQTGHLSTWRVLRGEFDAEVRGELVVYRYQTDRFLIEYAQPAQPLVRSDVPPWSDAEWATKGGVRRLDAFAPDYVEDLAQALESALTHFLSLTGSDGRRLFQGPSAGTRIPVEVTNGFDGAGDSGIGGPIRIKSRLSDLKELRLAAAHELIHVLQAEYYSSKVSAAMNRWFVEATASLFSMRFGGLTDEERAEYLRREWAAYLQSSLDASVESAYYAVADFLEWLERKTGKKLTADVLLADWTWDLEALSSLVTTGGDTLGKHFTEYALSATLGNNVLKPLDIWRNSTFAPGSMFQQHAFPLPHLSAAAIELKASAAVDGLLVAAPPASPASGFATYTFVGTAPQTSLAGAIESTTPVDKPVVVKHFGKEGTPGVAVSIVRQLVVNPAERDVYSMVDVVLGSYLLAPPSVAMPVAPGQVQWTFDPPRRYVEAGHYAGTIPPFEPILGFNVYDASGRRLNADRVSASARAFSDARIAGGTNVKVTVVDVYGNEWPEPPAAPGVPTISAVNPVSGGAGTQVTITGTGFGTPDTPYATAGYNLKVGGLTHGLGTSWTDTRIVFTLGNLPVGLQNIVVTAGGRQSSPYPFTVTADCSVQDASSGLTWTVSGYAGSNRATYTSAQASVPSSGFCGRGGWRLPTQSELLNAASLLRAPPFVDNQGMYWSSTACNTAGSGYNQPGHVVVFVSDASTFCARDDGFAGAWPVHP